MALLKGTNGFLALSECLVSCSLLVLVTALAVPHIPYDRSHHDADVTVRSLALDLQALRNRSLTSGQSASTLKINEKEYTIVVSLPWQDPSWAIVKRVTLPAGLTIGGNSRSISFTSQGKPSKDMRIIVGNKVGTYSRTIILQAQTGRIRIE